MANHFHTWVKSGPFITQILESCSDQSSADLTFQRRHWQFPRDAMISNASRSSKFWMPGLETFIRGQKWRNSIMASLWGKIPLDDKGISGPRIKVVKEDKNRAQMIQRQLVGFNGLFLWNFFSYFLDFLSRCKSINQKSNKAKKKACCITKSTISYLPWKKVSKPIS